MAISGLTKALKDIMRMDEGINGDAQYIGQIAWLLFLKAFDYKEQEWELLEDDYKPVMPKIYQWRNWAADDEGITGNELLKFIEHMFDDILNISSDSMQKAKAAINEYGDIFKQALTAEIVSDDNKTKVYGEALKAVEAYNEAVLRSENPYEDKTVIKAKEDLDSIKHTIQENETEWERYSVLLDEVFEKADTRILEFTQALKTNTDIQQLAEDLKGLDHFDLKSFDDIAGENVRSDHVL